MKIIYRTFFLAILLGIAPMLVGQNDTITLEDIVTYHADYGNGHVSYQFDPSKSHLLPNFSKENLFTLYKHLFNISINKHDSVSIDMENVEGTAIRKHYDAVQLYKGVPIEHSQIRITEELGFVEVLGMNWTSIETRESGIPTLSEAEALNKAIVYTESRLYAWGTSLNTKTKGVPKGKLVWIENNKGEYILSYKFYIFSQDPFNSWNVFINAKEGSLVKKESQNSHLCSSVEHNSLDVDVMYNDEPQTITAKTSNGFSEVCGFYTLNQDNNNLHIEMIRSNGLGENPTDEEVQNLKDNLNNDANYLSYYQGNPAPPIENIETANGATIIKLVNDLEATYFWEDGGTGNVRNDLPPGFHKVIISGIQEDAYVNCTYDINVAVGGLNTENELTINTFIAPNSCTQLRLNISGVQEQEKYEILWKGPYCTEKLSTDPITSLSFIDYNVTFQALPGVYSFLARKIDAGNTLPYTAHHFFLAPQDCLPSLLKEYQSAYFGIQTIHDFFKGNQEVTINTATSNVATFDFKRGKNDVVVKNDFTESTVATKMGILMASSNIASGQFLDIDDNWYTTRFGGNWISLDAVGHEYVHAIEKKETKLEKLGESGILIEGFCDIFAILNEATINETLDWSIGDDFWDVKSQRILKNPKMSPEAPEPTTYKGKYWRTLSNPPTEQEIGDYIHNNSTVFSYWFYLLSQGGAGSVDDVPFSDPDYKPYLVKAIGLEKATRIVYNMLVSSEDIYQLTSQATFQEASQKSLKIAEDFYGKCTPTYESVVAAWEAVGISPLNVADCSSLPKLEVTYDKNCDLDFGEFTITIDINDGIPPYTISGTGIPNGEVQFFERNPEPFTTEVLPGSAFDIRVTDALGEDIEVITGIFDCPLCPNTNNQPPTIAPNDEFREINVCPEKAIFITFDVSDLETNSEDLIPNLVGDDVGLLNYSFDFFPEEGQQGLYFLEIMPDASLNNQTVYASAVFEDGDSGCSLSVCKELILNVFCQESCTSPICTEEEEPNCGSSLLNGINIVPNRLLSPTDTDCKGAIELLVDDPKNYTFVWENCEQCDINGLSNLCSGSYTVTITNTVTGCSEVQTLTVPDLGLGSPLGGLQINPEIYERLTKVTFPITEVARATLKVLDEQDKQVQVLLDNVPKQVGIHTIIHDAQALPDGLYKYELTTDEGVQTITGIKRNIENNDLVLQNPVFKETARLTATLAKNTSTTLKVLDAQGSEVARLIDNEQKTAGQYEIEHDVSNLADGLYTYEIETADWTKSIQGRKTSLPIRPTPNTNLDQIQANLSILPSFFGDELVLNYGLENQLSQLSSNKELHKVVIQAYHISGTPVGKLLDSYVRVGDPQELVVDASDLATGVYLFRLNVDGVQKVVSQGVKIR